MTLALSTVRLPDDALAPRLGQGTWRMGEKSARASDEVAALRRGLDLGLGLIDTAEMYGSGGAERIVGEAIAGRRDETFIVSKALPDNAAGAALRRACENSLRRLGIERIDLYLLHWRGSSPLKATVEGMENLRREGKIGHWGVSNFDVDDMEELFAAGGARCATNQILYNLSRRGPELSVLPALAARRIPTMAYSPVEQGRLVKASALTSIAARLGATPAQVALAWTMRRPDVIAIPKASSIAHVEENTAAADLHLDEATLEELDRAFPAPKRSGPLAML